MLRLSPPGRERLFQTSRLDSWFVGSEANCAVSLALFGLDVAYVTALPDNPIADACIETLRAKGVDTRFIARQGERMGVFFIELGADHRPMRVIYDRGHSAISTARVEDFNWESIFDGAAWLHVTGITPGLSQSAADLTLAVVKKAKEKGLTISCDYNYRKPLWRYGKNAPEVMREVVQYVDIAIANAEGFTQGLGIAMKGEEVTDSHWYRRMAETVLQMFPNLHCQASTMRIYHSASHNGWSACLYNGKEFLVSREYDLTHIVDRVGAGDAFAAGLIYGLFKGMPDQEALEFATAAGCLKHTIPGDMNLVSVAEIQQLLR